MMGHIEKLFILVRLNENEAVNRIESEENFLRTERKYKTLFHDRVRTNERANK